MEVVARSSADSAPKAARSSGARYRSALTNSAAFLPKQPLSRRALDRRRKDLVSSFMAALGPDAMNGLTAVMVRKAAELTVAAEVARANMLNGVPTDMLALVRLEGVAARAVRVLGIKVEKPRGGDGGLTIARARWEEQRAQEKAKKAATEVREATATHTTEPPDDRA